MIRRVPAVDNRLRLDYTEHRSEGATGKRLAPYLITEVTAGWEAGRLLLFIGLDEQGNNGNEQNNRLDQIRVCNHWKPPFRKCDQGAKKRP